MKNALLSVSDKAGIVEFAKNLEALDFQIISTGGTFRALQDGGIKNLVEVSEFSGSPEGLDGRIKTLSPKIFGGILNLRNNEGHKKFCEENGIENLDLVVVNLYPFKKNYYDEKKSFEQKVEQIDIGGPSMIRAAAKNFGFCAPIVDPADYEIVINEIKTDGDISLETRKILATKVFEMTAHYDLLIAKFWAENSDKMPLRYGENPHQKAVALTDPFTDGANLIGAEVLNGKPMSFNNFGDGSGAMELAMNFPDVPFATIIKHASPCCAAFADTIEEAFAKSLKMGDDVSAFGGVIAVNRKVTKALAEQMISFFSEIVIAPDYDDDALEVLRTKKNLRILKVPHFGEITPDLSIKKVRGGTLVQDSDIALPDFEKCEVPTKKKPTDDEKSDLALAWKIVKIVKSNAIVVVKDGALVGACGGQTSRVLSMENALRAAGDNAKGAIIASDAFFPFADAIEEAGKYDISLIVQPGGSIRDQEVFDKCDELNMAMVLTKMRSFLH